MSTVDTRLYRECVRVVIVKKDKILLGKKFIKGKFVCYEFPGGGIEDNQTPQETVVKEMLEEVAIKVNKVELLNYSQKYEINYPNPERAKLYRGGVDIWCTCDFVKYDDSLFDVENDALPYTWVTVDDAIKLIKEGPQSDYNVARLHVLNMINDKKNNKEQPRYSKW